MKEGRKERAGVGAKGEDGEKIEGTGILLP